VFCANTSDGILTAHPYLKGEQLQDIKGKKGYPLGKEIVQNATEGTIKELTYWWPRPGTEKPLEKITFYRGSEIKTAGLATTRITSRRCKIVCVSLCYLKSNTLPSLL
jgi:hypothetical protein